MNYSPAREAGRLSVVLKELCSDALAPAGVTEEISSLSGKLFDPARGGFAMIHSSMAFAMLSGLSLASGLRTPSQ